MVNVWANGCLFTPSAKRRSFSVSLASCKCKFNIYSPLALFLASTNSCICFVSSGELQRWWLLIESLSPWASPLISSSHFLINSHYLIADSIKAVKMKREKGDVMFQTYPAKLKSPGCFSSLYYRSSGCCRKLWMRQICLYNVIM